MSLTSHLKQTDSPIGRFLMERFPNTRTITKETNPQLRSADTILPTNQSAHYPYMTVGMALDYRFRYYFDVPEVRQLLAWQGIQTLAFRWVSEDPGEKGVVTNSEEYRELFAWSGYSAESAVPGPYSWRVLKAFFDGLAATVSAIKPVGRCLELDKERILAQYCYVLALLDAVSREGLSESVRAGRLFQPEVKRSFEELLSIPEDEWLADICALSWRFYDTWRDHLSQPFVLNPTFAGSNDVGGADADLIVDGCLIELKASVKPEIRTEWLRQLAGYLLLDYDDEYKIKALSIYMARQGALFTWPVDEFLQKLSSDPPTSVAALRQEFRTRFSRRREQTLVTQESIE